jgi:hypothetical protein
MAEERMEEVLGGLMARETDDPESGSWLSRSAHG